VRKGRIKEEIREKEREEKKDKGRNRRGFFK
jgi:hypothetical protein